MKKFFKFSVLLGFVLVYAVIDITSRLFEYLINIYIKAEGKWV